MAWKEEKEEEEEKEVEEEEEDVGNNKHDPAKCVREGGWAAGPGDTPQAQYKVTPPLTIPQSDLGITQLRSQRD